MKDYRSGLMEEQAMWRLGGAVSQRWAIWEQLFPDRPYLIRELREGMSWKFAASEEAVESFEAALQNQRRPRWLNSERRRSMQEMEKEFRKHGFIGDLTEPEEEGFIALLFSQEKASGGLRWLIDWSQLNDALESDKYKAHGIAGMADRLPRGAWFCNLDYRKFFHLFYMHKQMHKYQRVWVNGKLAEFKVVIMGAKPSAHRTTEYPRLMLETMARLGGVQTLHYTDEVADWVPPEEGPQAAFVQHALLLLIGHVLGFATAWDKDVWLPQQRLRLLGWITDSVLLRVSPDRGAASERDQRYGKKHVEPIRAPGGLDGSAQEPVFRYARSGNSGLLASRPLGSGLQERASRRITEDEGRLRRPFADQGRDGRSLPPDRGDARRSMVGISAHGGTDRDSHDGRVGVRLGRTQDCVPEGPGAVRSQEQRLLLSRGTRITSQRAGGVGVRPVLDVVRPDLRRAGNTHSSGVYGRGDRQQGGRVRARQDAHTQRTDRGAGSNNNRVVVRPERSAGEPLHPRSRYGSGPGGGRRQPPQESLVQLGSPTRSICEAMSGTEGSLVVGGGHVLYTGDNTSPVAKERSTRSSPDGSMDGRVHSELERGQQPAPRVSQHTIPVPSAATFGQGELEVGDNGGSPRVRPAGNCDHAGTHPQGVVPVLHPTDGPQGGFATADGQFVGAAGGTAGRGRLTTALELDWDSYIDRCRESAGLQGEAITRWRRKYRWPNPWVASHIKRFLRYCQDEGSDPEQLSVVRIVQYTTTLPNSMVNDATSAISALGELAWDRRSILQEPFVKVDRVAARNAHKPQNTGPPAVDLHSMWEGLEQWVQGRGGVRKLTDAELTRATRATLTFDLCARQSDITSLAWAPLRTEPRGVAWNEASIVYLLARNTKEVLLATKGPRRAWTEIPLYVNKKNKRREYRSTLSLTFLIEYDRRLRLQGQPRLRELEGRSVWMPRLFPRLAQRSHTITVTQDDTALSSDRISKAVRWLMELPTPKIAVEPRFARHIGASYVKHLWCDDKFCDRSWLTDLLRHAEPAHDRTYISETFPDSVRHRRGRQRESETFTELIRS
mmetsp:Transcript_21810/g.65152  ORF Transcript_21810/g.65152 Transcript_21810/m.65152 type:complete len:1065 (+) Transcript_21810:1475-4669(+)